MTKLRASLLALACWLAAGAAALAQPYSTTGGYGSPVVQSTGAALSAIRPLDVRSLGSYSKALTSGTMAAGLAANAPVFSFRYGGANLAVVRAVYISAADVTTAFAATQATFAMFPARSFTASDSGGTAGTLTGSNGKLRTSFGTTAVSDIRIASTAALTPGTRTLDTDPIAALTSGPTATAGVNLTNSTILFAPDPAIAPLVLATNEGFVVHATVPATGTWTFSITVQWDEFPLGFF